VQSSRDLEDLTNTDFDVAVIGGGCTGVGVLRDAALRGLKAVLFEKHDFGSETSAKSTRFVGGAIRYLQMLDIRLVLSTLRESKNIRKIAPHLVLPKDIIIPVYKDTPYSPFEFKLAIFAYWLLGGEKGAYLSLSQVKEKEPTLPSDGLRGAVLLHEAEIVFSERLHIDTIQSAREHGALAYNHMTVIGLLINDKQVCGLRVKDEISDRVLDVKARVVVNGSGPWLNEILQMLPVKTRAAVCGGKGVHLLTERIAQNGLVVIASDKRYLYSHPIFGGSLVGSTDTETREPLDSVHATADDKDYLLKQYRAKGFALDESRIFYAIAGVRPLQPDLSKGASTSEISQLKRSWKVYDHKEDGISGLISVIGGNIGTYRGRAEEVTDLVCKKLGRSVPCSTKNPLPSALDISSEDFEKRVAHESEKAGLSPEQVRHLCYLYGSNYPLVLELASHDPGLKERICVHNLDIRAQIQYAAKNELVETLSDFLLDRTAIGWARCEGLDCATSVAETLGAPRGWSAQRIESEVSKYRSIIELRHKF
jgi:glycerol-3-phosphate dehydrogenase